MVLKHHLQEEQNVIFFGVVLISYFLRVLIIARSQCSLSLMAHLSLCCSMSFIFFACFIWFPFHTVYHPKTWLSAFCNHPFSLPPISFSLSLSLSPTNLWGFISPPVPAVFPLPQVISSHTTSVIMCLGGSVTGSLGPLLVVVTVEKLMYMMYMMYKSSCKVSLCAEWVCLCCSVFMVVQREWLSGSIIQ